MPAPTPHRAAAFHAAAVLILSLAGADPAAACACCSNEAQRNITTEPLDAYAKGLLEEVRYAEAAHLYTGEADVGDAGITANGSDFRLALTMRASAWVFAFTEDGGSGTLTLEPPSAVTKFMIDPREAAEPASGTGPALYKEWRLEAAAKGSGMFASAMPGNGKATLILHGRGNSCTDASQFNAWTLAVEGAKGSFTLYGDLTRQ